MLDSLVFLFSLHLRQNTRSWEAPLSQTELADKAGTYWAELAKLERGEQEPSWREVQAICRALGGSCEAFAEK